MKKVLLAMLIMVSFPLSVVHADPSPVDLVFGYVDPADQNSDQHRTSPAVPEVSIEDYTLSFVTPCDGCTLRLLDGNDNVVFNTIISSSTIVLPSTLFGDYRIEIISGSYCFWGFVNL